MTPARSTSAGARLRELARSAGFQEPAHDLDPYLDAAARCFSRYGVLRTSVPDVARELGVSRSTVYRRVGSIEGLGMQLASRELHRFLRTVSGGGVVELISSGVAFAAQHPVVRKLVSDEPELVGRFLVVRHAAVLALVVGPLSRLLSSAGVTHDDPRLVAETVVRLAASFVIAPPPRDVAAHVHEAISALLGTRRS